MCCVLTSKMDGIQNNIGDSQQIGKVAVLLLGNEVYAIGNVRNVELEPANELLLPARVCPFNKKYDSGTVSATFEGTLLGIPSVAFSI